jgi:hypothetical protein
MNFTMFSVEVFDTGLSNVIKRAETDYLLTKGYTDRNIIGLPSETRANVL